MGIGYNAGTFRKIDRCLRIPKDDGMMAPP
jgi:hypothetical protein